MYLHLTTEQRRARDRVAGEGLVEVEEDTGVAGPVEGRGRGTAGPGASTAGNLNVDALGVELGTVGASGSVESNDLVTENILARGDRRWDGNSPRVSVRDELISSPPSGVRARDETTLGNLSKAQRTSIGVGGSTGRLVASDVWRASRVGLNETVVQVVGGPTHGLRGDVSGDSAGVGDTVGDDAGNVAMGVDLGDSRQDSEEDGANGHFGRVFVKDWGRGRWLWKRGEKE
jgi:hypothetical protein